MQLIRGQHNLYQHLGACYATIGTFDGLHLGHQAVLKSLCEKAKAANLPTVVILFEPHPQEFLFPEKAAPRLSLLRDKLIHLRQLGIDKVVCLRFDLALARLTAEAFIEEILIKSLNIQHLVVGDDFHFGSNRQGSFSLLKSYGEKSGFTVESTQSLIYENERISSTRVRQAILQNQFQLVEKLLGRKYSLQGRVHHGDKRGRTLGFPTINMPLPKKMAVQGVFAVMVKGLNHLTLKGVANVGVRPTVQGVRRLLEVHLFDFTDECYGKNLEVIFCHRLRDEMKFASLVDLRSQIAQDVENAKHYFNEMNS